MANTLSLFRKNKSKTTLLALLLFVVSACVGPAVPQGEIQVEIIADGNTVRVSVPAGSSASQAIQAAGLDLDLLDRTEPPQYSIIAAGSQITIVRVTEELEIEQQEIQYKIVTLPNESLPEGETRLVQAGENGLQEITVRRVFENGIEISRSPIQTIIVIEPTSEIVMIGSRAVFTAQDISGRLAYISSNNAWVMEGSTGIRTPVVATGDLDGRIFTLSPDGVWLLYTRSDDDPENKIINTLWLSRVDGEAETTIDLKTSNVIHFADFIPGSNNGISVSTVEFTPNPPGWQANNDLILMYFSENGWVGNYETIITANSGGLYGWWGTNFAWSPDGEQLAYSRPDGIGLVDLNAGEGQPLLNLNSFQTGSDWAWVPGINWSPDSTFIFTVNHTAEEGLISPEESPIFNLSAIPLIIGAPLSMVAEVGMFAHPVPSPAVRYQSGEEYFRIAYLQAIAKRESLTSEYQLVVRDRDGSNPVRLFPPDGHPGLNPQAISWSPEPFGQTGAFFIALIYQGNLWIIDVDSGRAYQLTGDGFVTALDWN